MRYIGRMFLPSGGRKQQFNPFQNNNRKGNNKLDQIEEAEYEDLSDKKE